MSDKRCDACGRRVSLVGHRPALNTYKFCNGKPMTEKVEVLVDGGAATPGPPLGPALGPLGVDIPRIVKEINERTKPFAGMKVPVKILIEKDKSFDIIVGTPPTSALILKELGVEKGSGKAGTETIGNLDMAAVLKIAKMKQGEALAKSLKKTVKEIVGTCGSMGVTIDGKNPREIQKLIDAGFYNIVIQTLTSS